jgi:peptidoglycan-N-acetylglucosamine deacetylase
MIRKYTGIAGTVFAVILSLAFAILAQPAPVFHGPRQKKDIALTFDACPTRAGGGWDEGVFQYLKSARIPATFFLSGKWMEAEPVKVMELAGEAFFEIANHSYSHPHLTRLSDEAVRQELASTEKLLQAFTKNHVPFFRPPFGEWDPRLVALAAREGLRTIQYDLASGDPDPHIDAKRMAEYVVRQARGGSIVVFHVNGRGWNTAGALPAIVSGLHQRGFSLVLLSDLLSGSW